MAADAARARPSIGLSRIRATRLSRHERQHRTRSRSRLYRAFLHRSLQLNTLIAVSFLAIALGAHPTPVAGRTDTAACRASGFQALHSLGFTAKPRALMTPAHDSSDLNVLYPQFAVELEFLGRGCEPTKIQFVPKSPRFVLKLLKAAPWLISADITGANHGVTIGARVANGNPLKIGLAAPAQAVSIYYFSGQGHVVVSVGKDINHTREIGIAHCGNSAVFFETGEPEHGAPQWPSC